MRIIGSIENGGSVKEALQKIGKTTNEKLSNTPGSIAGIETNINVGLSGAKIQLILTIDDKKNKPKKILWTNKGGSNEGEALSKAQEELNPKIEKLSGEIADYHLEFLSPPLPQRIYVTIIIGINETIPQTTHNLDTEERRARLREIINQLGGEATAINISKTANVFGVTRDVIYRDIEKLGFSR